MAAPAQTLTNVETTNTFEEWRVKTNNVIATIGNHLSLTTTSKELVGSLIELRSLIGDLSTIDGVPTSLAQAVNGSRLFIGDLDSLLTVEKTDLVAAINELHYEVFSVSAIATINAIEDVDTLSTPPTEGQALVWDPNSGVSGQWIPGDAVSQWITTGSDIYYNTGKVAVGIATTPTYTLDINKSSDGTIGSFRRIGATNNVGIQLTASEADNTVGIDTISDTATDPDLVFAINGAEKTRIDNNGILSKIRMPWTVVTSATYTFATGVESLNIFADTSVSGANGGIAVTLYNAAPEDNSVIRVHNITGGAGSVTFTNGPTGITVTAGSNAEITYINSTYGWVQTQ